MQQLGWTVIKTNFEASQLHHKETLFTTSNGYLGTRGSFEEGYPKDVRGNVREGIHAASTGGVWQAVVFGFVGVKRTPTGPSVVNPQLPPSWTRLQFKLRWRDRAV